MTKNVMDDKKQLDKRVTRLEDYFRDSDHVENWQSPSSNLKSPQKKSQGTGHVSNQSTEAVKSVSDIQPNVPLALKPPKKSAFTGLPVIVENLTATLDTKKYKKTEEKAVSLGHETGTAFPDKPRSNLVKQHFQKWREITLGKNKDIQWAKTRPAAFEEQPAFINEQYATVFLWTLSGPEPYSDKQVSIIDEIDNEKFVKRIKTYPMPKLGDFTIVYEHMPVSLAEIAASRQVRGPELAFILKQVRL
ncbi:unnamed protein product [Fusarium graminearum]|uniref:Uncharacterized protein n=1 Tax=Gibberella zeae TaxID=5518 RepID=A0A9N8RMN4_GIBZA|nr:unnamed protein product [Fusarium graminearum]